MALRQSVVERAQSENKSESAHNFPFHFSDVGLSQLEILNFLLCQVNVLTKDGFFNFQMVFASADQIYHFFEVL